MRCDRCRGPMVETRLFDEEASLWAWRCPICGDVRDSVIDFHHRLPVPPEPVNNVLPTYHPYDHLELIRRRRLAQRNGGGPDVPASR